MNPNQWSGDGEEGLDNQPGEHFADDPEDIQAALREGGHLPSGEPSLEREEILDRLRQKANEEMQAAAELPAKDQAEIKGFLTTLRIPKANEITPQELELMWRNLNENPSLVKDLTYLLITRDTENNYSSYPLLPSMPEIIEYITIMPKPDKPENSDVVKLRPLVIEGAVIDLAKLGFSAEKIRSIAGGHRGDELADKMRLVGWLAGFPFMQKAAPKAITEQLNTMGLARNEATVSTIARAFMVVMLDEISELKRRNSRYNAEFNMDQRGLEVHVRILEAMQGIQSLLYKAFID